MCSGCTRECQSASHCIALGHAGLENYTKLLRKDGVCSKVVVKEDFLSAKELAGAHKGAVEMLARLHVLAMLSASLARCWCMQEPKCKQEAHAADCCWVGCGRCVRVWVCA